MLHQLNDPFPIKFIVVNAAGQRVTTASPTVVIMRDNDKMYWDGLVWQVSRQSLPLTHLSEGVYLNEFTPDQVGNYTIICDELMYNVTDIIGLEVVNDTAPAEAIVSITGDVFDFKVAVVDPNSNNRIVDASPTIKIIDDNTKLYWDGERWVNLGTPPSLAMEHIAEGIYSYPFKASHSGVFSVAIDCPEWGISESRSLKVFDSVEDAQSMPILVTSSTIKSTDGTDCRLIDENGDPIADAYVNVYDEEKNLVTRTKTRTDGTWSLYVRTGKHIFEFSKEDYIDELIERVI